MKIERLILLLIGNKKKVDSSYFFVRLLAHLGYLGSVSEPIASLKENGYIEHDGYFDASGIAKDIILSPKGALYLASLNSTEVFSEMESLITVSEFWEGLKEQLT